MEEHVKVHMSCDDNFCIHLAIECPSCHTQQSFPVADIKTGLGFVCACGDDFPVNVAALAPVRQELEEVKHLINKTITLPI